jgi:CheY-like chemotaxis protein
LEILITGGHLPEGVHKSKKHILIVDDDPSYAKMVREWIKDHYQVSIVTAGIQAITFLAKNPVDMILLDYEMPVVDGAQVLQMLRQEPSTQNIPVIFLTGVGDKEQVERVLRLRPTGYILKSTTKEKLLDYLHAHVHNM